MSTTRRTALFSTLAFAASSARAEPLAASARVGGPAPPFQLKLLGGQTVTSEDLRGQVVILNFWAVWCAPCRVELPLLDAYARGRPDLRIFAVMADDSVSRDDLRSISRQFALPFVLRMRGRGYGALKGAVPTNYVIDRAGVVRYAKAAALDVDDLQDIVAPLLAEPAASRPSGGQG
jgi:thiol-disulfide isomerase/thioredoxin